jgi:hypothetical protein
MTTATDPNNTAMTETSDPVEMSTGLFPKVVLMKFLVPTMDGILQKRELDLTFEDNDGEELETIDADDGFNDWVTAQMEGRSQETRQPQRTKKGNRRGDTGKPLMQFTNCAIETRWVLNDLKELGYKLIAITGYRVSEKNVLNLVYKKDLDEHDQILNENDLPTEAQDLLSFIIGNADNVLAWTGCNCFDNRQAGKDVGSANFDGPTQVPGLRPLQARIDEKGFMITATHKVVRNDRNQAVDLELLDEPVAIDAPLKGSKELTEVRAYRKAAAYMARQPRD